mgnify:CR=1 FL=1
MRFLNQAGETFDHTSFKMCGKFDGMCGGLCPIFQKIGKTQITHKDCTDWIEQNPETAAQIMEYRLADQSIKPDKKMAATRRSILDKAITCVCEDRESQYRGPENSFKAIASLWNSFLYSKGLIVNKSAECKEIKPEDVAVMMALLKIARISTGTFKEDSYVDACGYLACGGELEGSVGNKPENE